MPVQNFWFKNFTRAKKLRAKILEQSFLRSFFSHHSGDKCCGHMIQPGVVERKKSPQILVETLLLNFWSKVFGPLQKHALNTQDFEQVLAVGEHSCDFE